MIRSFKKYKFKIGERVSVPFEYFFDIILREIPDWQEAISSILSSGIEIKDIVVEKLRKGGAVKRKYETPSFGRFRITLYFTENMPKLEVEQEFMIDLNQAWYDWLKWKERSKKIGS